MSYWPLTRPAAAKWTDCWLDRHRMRPSGGEDGAAGDVEGLLADLADAAPDHVVDVAGVGQARALGERVKHMGRQVDRVNSGQGTVPLAHWRPNRRHDHRVTHRAALLIVEFSLLPTTSVTLCPCRGRPG
jgi:hypothetical protein